MGHGHPENGAPICGDGSLLAMNREAQVVLLVGRHTLDGGNSWPIVWTRLLRGPREIVGLSQRLGGIRVGAGEDSEVMENVWSGWRGDFLWRGAEGPIEPAG